MHLSRQDKTRQCFIWSLTQSYVYRLYPNRQHLEIPQNKELRDIVCRLLEKTPDFDRESTRLCKKCFRRIEAIYKRSKDIEDSKREIVEPYEETKAVYDICRLQTADCMRQHNCKLNETKNVVIKVASSSTLPCSEKYM